MKCTINYNNLEGTVSQHVHGMVYFPVRSTHCNTDNNNCIKIIEFSLQESIFYMNYMFSDDLISTTLDRIISELKRLLTSPQNTGWCLH